MNTKNAPQEIEVPDWFRPVVAPLLERAISHADKVFWPLIGIAQQGWPFVSLPPGRTSLVRNKFAMTLLQSDFSHILMLDIDHIHPVNIVQRLGKWIINDPDKLVVAALVFRRGEPYEPCCSVLGDDGKYYPPHEWGKGLIHVDGYIGTGAIMISRKVFELMEPPWFYDPLDRVWEDIWPGEDVGFSMNCRKYGIDMWVDTTTTCPHVIDTTVTETTFRTFFEASKSKIVEIKDVKAAYAKVVEEEIEEGAEEWYEEGTG